MWEIRNQRKKMQYSSGALEQDPSKAYLLHKFKNAFLKNTV